MTQMIKGSFKINLDEQPRIHDEKNPCFQETIVPLLIFYDSFLELLSQIRSHTNIIKRDGRSRYNSLPKVFFQ